MLDEPAEQGAGQPGAGLQGPELRLRLHDGDVLWGHGDD
jgi:hypothetical protein